MRPHLFGPLYQKGGTTQQVYAFLKVAGSSAVLRSGLRREVAHLEPRAGAFDLMTLKAWTEVTLIPQTVAAGLLAALRGLRWRWRRGCILKMADGVTQRRREIGIRMAMGARVPNVVGTVMQWRMAVFRLVGSMLIAVSTYDWRSFGGAAVLLLVVAAAACYLPARRAAQIDPMVALRAD